MSKISDLNNRLRGFSSPAPEDKQTDGSAPFDSRYLIRQRLKYISSVVKIIAGSPK